MRILIFILLFPFVAQSQIINTSPYYNAMPAAGGIVFIGQIGAGSSDGITVTTGSLNTTGATLIVVGVSSYSLSEPTLTDSKGNTWTGLTEKINVAAAARTRLFYCYAPTVGSGHTFTVSASPDARYPSVTALAFSGTSGTFDVENGTTGGSSPVAAGAVTPAANGEVIIGALGTNALTATTAITSGFTNYDIAYGAAAHFSLSVAYYIQPTAGSKNCEWTWADGGTGSAVIAAFK